MSWIRLPLRVLGGWRGRRPGPSTPGTGATPIAGPGPARGNLKRWLVIGLVALVVPGALALAAILWWRRRATSKGTA